MRFFHTVLVVLWIHRASGFSLRSYKVFLTSRRHVSDSRIVDHVPEEELKDAHGEDSPEPYLTESGEIEDLDLYLSSLTGESPKAQWPPVPENYDLRRSLYKALKPLDKGDFRWEMLVPWLPPDKKLTQEEKIIIFVTFVALALTGQELVSPEASVSVHLSYVANFFSYAIGNPVGFRIIAMVGSLLEIIGDIWETKLDNSDGIPVLYNLIFIPINGYYVMRWLLNREALALNEEEEALFILCFAPLGFTRAQFSRLLTTAEFESVPKASEGGEPRTLCHQDEPLFDIFVPISIIVKGVVASKIPPYQLIGEASLLENLQSEGGKFHPPSRSTVVAEPGSFYVSWPQQALFDLQASDPDIAYTIQLMIARTLSLKLRAARLSQQRAVEQLRASSTMTRGDDDDDDGNIDDDESGSEGSKEGGAEESEEPADERGPTREEGKEEDKDLGIEDERAVEPPPWESIAVFPAGEGS